MADQLPLVLTVQNGPNPGRVFVIQGPVQTIGRGSDNDIVIDESSLSRRHARIKALADGFVIEDLGSTNGTFVNGQQVTGPTRLHPGDTLQLGDVVTLSVQSGQPDDLEYQQTILAEDSTLAPGQPPPGTEEPTFVPGQPPPGTPETLVPGTPPYTAARPVPLPAAPPPPVYHPPARRISPWVWIGLAVILILLGAIVAELYYYFVVLKVPQPQTPTEIAQTPTAVQAQPALPTSTPPPVPTATPSPTPEPTEMAVPGIPAIAAEEGEPPENLKQIEAGCNRHVEVRADEPVAITWNWVVAEDSETDYLAQWLEVAHYDVRLDAIPITELGSLKYYRTEACRDNGECGPALSWWVNAGILSAVPHHVTIDVHTTRPVSDGFDANPADGELDVHGPGLVDARVCDIVVVEVAAPTSPPAPATPPTSAPVSTQPSPVEVTAFPLGVFQDFEDESAWKLGDQPYGELTRSTAQVQSGSYAGQLTYDFPTVDNEFVVFLQTRHLAGRPNAISAWVYGDNSGHYFNVWIKDADGEVWQAPFGQIEHTGWQRMTAWLDPGREWPHAHVSGPSNNVIDYPISFHALVLDDIPDTFSGRGTIYIDDLTSEEGAPPPQ